MSFVPFAKKTLFFALQVALAIIVFNQTSKFCQKQTDGFSVLKISSSLKNQAEWDIPVSQDKKQELEKILSQRFTYLGFGGQCYAFASEDGQYVLKFFIDQLYFPPIWALSFPLPDLIKSSWSRKIEKKLSKVQRDFSSCKIAYEDLREDSGLLFVHLNKTQDLWPKTTIVDKLHIAHEIDLNSKEFVLQRKAEPFLAHFDRLIKQNDLEGMRQSLQSIFDVLVFRCQKGIFDEDPSIHRNLGFIGNKAIFIDIGRFKKDASRKDPCVYKKDIKAIANRIKERLAVSHPQLTVLLDDLAWEEND